jgi:hypothetical protein
MVRESAGSAVPSLNPSTRVLLALPAARGGQPHGCHHAVAVHIKTRAALDENVHPFLLSNGVTWSPSGGAYRVRV